MSWRLVCLSLILVAVAMPLDGGEVIVGWVEKYPTDGLMMKMTQKAQLKQLIKQLGEEEGRKQFEMINRTYFTIGLFNTDKVRRAVRVELLIEYLDKKGNKLAEERRTHDEPIPTSGDTHLRIDCEVPPCQGSDSLRVTVLDTEFVEVDYGTGEIPFEWKKKRWFLEDRWEGEGKLVLRSFSKDHYTDEGFDERVFPAGHLRWEEERFYRVARKPLPAGFGQDVVEPSIEHYTLLPGIVIEEGAARKPKFLSLGDAGIVTSGVSGTIEVGDYVQFKGIQYDKKSIILLVAPVCRKSSSHRRLRSRVRFVVGKQVMKGPDLEALDDTVHEWFEPVSIGEVARTCGPVSGTFILRWDTTTTTADVVAALGPPEDRAEVGVGETMTYGVLELHFVEDRLAGFKKNA